MKSFSRTKLAVAFAAALAGARNLASQQPPVQQPPVIRVGVDRVNVGVIVTDSKGHFVGGLRREDFRVFDNGIEQPLSGFLSDEDPAQVLLLVESGPAVLFVGKTNLLAADRLLASLAADDRVALASYSRTPELLFGFSPDKSLASLALSGLNFMNGFADLNLAASLDVVVNWLASIPGKKSVVLLCSGVNTSSDADWRNVLDKLKVSDVRVLAVSLSQNLHKPARGHKLSPQEKEAQAFLKQGFAQADQSLRQISAATGGRAYFPKDSQDFERAYVEIAELVRHEYNLAFAPPSFDGRTHSIEVKLRGFSYRVDHRQAYLAASANSN
jgi:Ca-activated chloride channel homolog